MFDTKTQHILYRALVDKNVEFEGSFFVGVKTTGIFCRPTCPARKTKFKNCEFYTTAKEALLASYRPCLRCQPLSHPSQTSNLIQTLVNAIEKNPEKRWKTADFKTLCIDESTARRQFKKRFGMTFVEYARARRMGIAIKHIRSGDSIIEAQLNTGYESSNGFRDAFSKIMGAPPTKLKNENALLKTSWLDTPLGPMIAIADEEGLYLLEFIDRRGLEREIERLRIRMKAVIIPGMSLAIEAMDKELEQYFNGTLQTFKTPFHLIGSIFQKEAWDALIDIPYGKTRSYLEQAKFIGRPTAFRAVATANGANTIAIAIPCHRIINTNGELGGYGGGLARKKWLIEHEKRNAK